MNRLLRLALRAGNIREVLRLSREAKALQNLNATGGVGNTAGRGGPEGAIDYLNRMGVDPGASARYSPQPDGSRAFPAPGGGSTYLSPDGSRFRQQPLSSPSPIQTPTEGMRVMPPGTARSLRDYDVVRPPFAAGPWQGRGRSPQWQWEPGGLRGGGGVVDDIQYSGFAPGPEYRGMGISGWEDLQRQMAPIGIMTPPWVQQSPYYSPW